MGLKTRAARRKQSSEAFFPRRDVAARCLDFLEARDLFGRASLVSHALFDAASTLKGRLSLGTFDKISTCLDDEWDEKEVENSDYEPGSDSDDEGWYYDGRDQYGNYPYHTYYECVKCEIKRFALYTDYLWGWTKVTSLETDDLKDLIVIEKPEITFHNYRTYSAPNGRWFTVGDLFDTIAEDEASYREGPSNHVYFEGFGRDRRGHYGVTFWGS